MSQPVADLHVHTPVSDGTLTLDELPDAARAAGVGVVAVTDHDRVHPDIEAPVVDRDGVELIRGIELRVEPADDAVGRVDLLGYALDPTDELLDELERVQRDRVERGGKIIERVETHLDVDLDLEPREGIGRPHVARAVEASEAPYDAEAAFRQLIGSDGPCFVPRDVTGFEEGAALLADSCAVVSLAHPFRYPDPEAALALAESPHLDAVERFYPYGREVDTDLVDRVAAEGDLLRTGGSDAHGKTLGKAGPDREAFDAFAARLSETEA
ncbi:PHP domain-containing protein [Halobium salinum]|uniref:PHP domain-containing protein n=1 Tax=Halobium salinum TaxID=1364940 RepID=A0ABD5PGA3_9EURY|nr:PHP domain-containing protein [Halobium salinum]